MPEEALIHETNWQEQPITTFEVDVQEDIPAELEAFIRLNRLGRFGEAKAFFEDALRPYVNLFPVFVEYADLLLEQGDFRGLSEFLDSIPNELFSAEETELISLLKALSDIYLHGALQSGLDQARRAWSFLKSQQLGPDGLPSDVQVSTAPRNSGNGPKFF
jgi:hypothetical protein